MDADLIGEEIPMPEGGRWIGWHAKPLAGTPGQTHVYLSRLYLVQMFDHPNEGWRRLTISRKDRGEIKMSWSRLQAIKDELLGPDVACIEHYPRAEDVIDVAHMRHLFIIPDDFDRFSIATWRND